MSRISVEEALKIWIGTKYDENDYLIYLKLKKMKYSYIFLECTRKNNKSSPCGGMIGGKKYINLFTDTVDKKFMLDILKKYQYPKNERSRKIKKIVKYGHKKGNNNIEDNNFIPVISLTSNNNFAVVPLWDNDNINNKNSCDNNNNDSSDDCSNDSSDDCSDVSSDDCSDVSSYDDNDNYNDRSDNCSFDIDILDYQDVYRNVAEEIFNDKSEGKKYCCICGDIEEISQLIVIQNHKCNNKNICEDCYELQKKQGTKFSKIINNTSYIMN